MLVLLPPSEGKTPPPARGRPLDLATLSSARLTESREQVLAALVVLCRTRPDAAAVLGLGPTQADEVDRNAALHGAPTARADQVYSGVLYEALDLPGLEAAARRRAANRVAITSALFGLLRPADRVPAYRLSGSVTLPGVGSVAGHWSRHLGPTVEEAAGGGLVVDLRSSAYVPFWRPSAAVAGQVCAVRVLHEVGGRRAVVSHANKATKGRLVRDLVSMAAAPRRPAALVTALRDLGWYVESAPDTRGRPARLDVVVSAL